MILNTGKTLLFFERFREFFGNDLPVFNITEQTVLVQAVYVIQLGMYICTSTTIYTSYTLVTASRRS